METNLRPSSSGAFFSRPNRDALVLFSPLDLRGKGAGSSSLGRNLKGAVPVLNP